jgi:hypothetical protein
LKWIVTTVKVNSKLVQKVICNWLCTK